MWALLGTVVALVVAALGTVSPLASVPAAACYVFAIGCHFCTCMEGQRGCLAGDGVLLRRLALAVGGIGLVLMVTTTGPMACHLCYLALTIPAVGLADVSKERVLALI